MAQCAIFIVCVVVQHQQIQQWRYESAPFLSRISQPENKLRYFLCCLALSTLVYSGFGALEVLEPLVTVPVFVVIYQAINFHHYIVDSLIWNVRSKPIQMHLGLK